MIKISDTTLSGIKEECLKSHKVFGYFNNRRFDLILLHVNGPNRSVIEESAARFNEHDFQGVLAFWTSKAELESYLFKLGQNAAWIAQGKSSNYVPYAPQALAASAIVAIDFDLPKIQSIIGHEEEKLIQTFGALPLEPTMIQYQDSGGFFRVFLRITWQS